MTTDYDELIGKLDLPAQGRAADRRERCSPWRREESIGLAELRLSDGPTGVRGLKFSRRPGGRAAPERHPAGLGVERGHRRTRSAGCSPRRRMAQEIHVVLGPTINLHRTRARRPAVRGVLRGPAAHRQARRRLRARPAGRTASAPASSTWSPTSRRPTATPSNSVVDEATLRELYLLPFEIAVDEADAWSIMAAYNDVNGVAATEQDHVINEVVKGEWGYAGLIMSDWFATKTAGPAANGGLDLVMPGPDGPWGDALVAAVAVRRGGRVGGRRPPAPAAAARRRGSARWATPRDVARGPAGAGQRRAPGAADPARRAGHDRADQRRRRAAAGPRRRRVALIGRHARRDDRHGRRLGAGQPAVPGERRGRA